MVRMLLAAVLAFAFLASQPAFACPDCKTCPQHEAAAGKAGTDGKAEPCACAKECKGAPEHKCTHSQGKKVPEKKDAKKT